MSVVAPTAAAATAPSVAHPPRNPWFRSARFDVLLILCVPFFTWPLVMAGQHAWGADVLTQLILLTATGHYFATFVRTYGDHELFARFRVRFLLTPAVLLATAIAMYASGNDKALLLLTALWGFWHWLAQAFGFARIYDIKAGSHRPLTSWLDKALVTAGFVGAVVLNSGHTATFGKAFLEAGVPLPAAGTYATMQTVVIVAMAAAGAAYVANLALTIVRRQPWSWQKQLMHVTTIGYYWFAFTWLPNVLVAYVLYELFHDIQYYAITWLTCTQRARRPGVASWFAAMFRPSFVAACAFVVVMTLFGALDVYGRHHAGSSFVHDASMALFLTAALLHYYYDGFIWKARESALANDLGIAGGLRAAVAPGLRHTARWAFFFVPLAALVALGRDEPAPRDRAEALLAVAPGDFVTHADLAMELTKERDLPAALQHYRASIAVNPDWSVTRVNFGAALDLAGDVDEAAVQYAAALRCADKNFAHATAHVNLGVLLLLRGERAAADTHFRAGRELGGEHPASRMLALAAALPPAANARRIQLCNAVLQLDPGNPRATALKARFGG
jgi:tetratricopeptide (TPR) repeat protein